MRYVLHAFEDLVEALKLFPGIGPKTAERMALYLLKRPVESVQTLSKVIWEARKRIRSCSKCFLFTEEDVCPVCKDSSRDARYLCVIEQPNQAFVMEGMNVFKGRYHVLMGKISPLDGVGPEDLHVQKLAKRVEEEKPEEVILAMGMDVEGEATSIYLASLLKSYPVKVSRIAYGIPVGMGIDYADAQTLSRALEGRRSMN